MGAGGRHRQPAVRWPGTGELVVPRTPYIVPHRVARESIEILRLVHTARRWPEEPRGRGECLGPSTLRRIRDALAAIHESASDFHDADVMGEQDPARARRAVPDAGAPMAAADIRVLRTRERVSQAVFARHLNVTTGLISQWERGEKHPAGASLKLLTLVDRHGLDAIA